MPAPGGWGRRQTGAATERAVAGRYRPLPLPVVDPGARETRALAASLLTRTTDQRRWPPCSWPSSAGRPGWGASPGGPPGCCWRCWSPPRPGCLGPARPEPPVGGGQGDGRRQAPHAAPLPLRVADAARRVVPALGPRPVYGLRLPRLQLLRPRGLLHRPGPAGPAAPGHLGRLPLHRSSWRRCWGQEGPSPWWSPSGAGWPWGAGRLCSTGRTSIRPPLQRGAVPEALGLGLLPWLPFGAWQTWRAETPGRQAAWLAATALATAALLLTHTLVAAGLAITLAWRGPALILPDRAPWAGWPWPSSWAPASRSLLAPRGGESGAVQLEIGREGAPGPPGLAARPGGQQREAAVGGEPPDPRGAADLHLFYPHQHQFVVTLKPGLAQAWPCWLLLCRASWRPLVLSAGAPAPPVRPRWRLPFPALALVCWALLFTFSEPPVAPRARPLPLAGRGACWAPSATASPSPGRGPGAPVDAGRERSLTWGRAQAGPWPGRPGPGAAQRVGRREVPYYPDPKRAMDGRMIVQGRRTASPTSGRPREGVHPGRRADRRLHRRAAPGVGVFERLYPEREWTGGLFQPLSGDLRFLGWQQAPCASACAWSTTSAPARLGVRQFRFPGWRAWMDGKRIPVEVAPYVPQQQAGLGFIVLTVPPGGAHAQPGPRAHPLEGRRDGPGRPRRAGLAGALLGARRARLPLPATLALLGACLLTLLPAGLRP